jgi:hypothetical protein
METQVKYNYKYKIINVGNQTASNTDENDIGYVNYNQYTVPTQSLGTRERSLRKNLVFAASPKFEFFTETNEIFLRSIHK